MIDGTKLKASYLALLEAEMTVERRTSLWEKAKQRFPEMAEYFLAEFEKTSDADRSELGDRLSGAMFMFLSLANALDAAPKALTGAPAAPALPGFGFLKPLVLRQQA
jgi:hypothetical protein